MKGIDVYHFNVPKGCVQGAKGPNHYLSCRCFYARGLYVCLHRDKLRWNETYLHKLVAAWMNILLTFYFIGFVSFMVIISWLNLTIAYENVIVIQDIGLHNNLPFFWVDYYTLIYIVYRKLMKSMGNQSSKWLLLFMMKVIVWHFVSYSPKVMITLIVLLF